MNLREKTNIIFIEVRNEEHRKGVKNGSVTSDLDDYVSKFWQLLNF